MRAAEDLVLTEPLLVQRPKQTQRTHEVTRIENIIYDALEVKPGEKMNMVLSMLIQMSPRGSDELVLHTCSSCRA